MFPSRIARRVEPPLRAEAEEVLDLALREDVFLRVEAARARVARGERVDDAELRATVRAAAARREVRDDPAADRGRYVRRVVRGVEDPQASRLIRAFDGDAPVLADVD